METTHDLHDTISEISPRSRLFVSSAVTSRAVNRHHEWQLDRDDDLFVRLGNYVQISGKNWIISKDEGEVAYRTATKGVELLRDVEIICLHNQAKRKGDETTAPLSAGVPAWLISNVLAPEDARLPTGDGTDAYTPGTPRPLDAHMVEALLERTPAATLLLVPPRLLKSVQLAVPRNREIEVAPSRFMCDHSIFALDMSTWGLAWLRRITHTSMGDDKASLRCEFTLESRNEAKNGAIYDIA